MRIETEMLEKDKKKKKQQKIKNKKDMLKNTFFKKQYSIDFFEKKLKEKYYMETQQ